MNTNFLAANPDRQHRDLENSKGARNTKGDTEFLAQIWLRRPRSVGLSAFAKSESLTRAVPQPSAWRPALTVHSYPPAPSGRIVSRLPGARIANERR